MILKGRLFSFITDGWTSVANVGNVTCTARFIDPASWKLHLIVIGLFKKIVVQRLMMLLYKNQLTVFYRSYHETVAVVTDTAETIVVAGRLFV